MPLIIVTEFYGLIDPRGGTAGHGSSEETFWGVEINLNSMIPMGVNDLLDMDLENRHGEFLAVRLPWRKNTEGSAHTLESI